MASSPPAPPQSPASGTDEILTPGRKVQALLAGFENSDSDSDGRSLQNENSSGRRDISLTEGLPNLASHAGSDTEDDVPVARRSRMAARLNGRDRQKGKDPTNAQRSPDSLEQHDPTADIQASSAKVTRSNEDSEDELSRPVPRRRLFTKQRDSEASPSSLHAPATAPASPLFFPSPSSSRKELSDSHPKDLNVVNSPKDSTLTGNSKFLALVQKHRQARLEKEAADVAKRAAQAKTSKKDRKPSHNKHETSPVSSAAEDSDASNEAVADKFTQEARPTRKASKKAVEEMKRETQRMSRNMQLAHQARTKKKITKESLLARFNLSLPGLEQNAAQVSSSTNPSSDIGSDVEMRKGNETPPTSPLRESLPDVDKSNTATTGPDGSNATDDLVVEAPSIEFIELQTAPSPGKGKTRADDLPSESNLQAFRATSVPVVPITGDSMQATLDKPSARSRLLQLLRSRAINKELDDGDLDIVTATSDKRKYAAFEKLPKRKAKETASHLALRNLAHLLDGTQNSRSSMTTSEMETALRKAARAQAKEERQQRLDELKAKGVIVQTREEREKDQQEVEDLVERARQEAAEIQKREKEAAKKEGTYVKDDIDDDESDEDGDFEEELADEGGSDDSEDEEDGQDNEDEDVEDNEEPADKEGKLIDDAADEGGSDDEEEENQDGEAETELSEEDQQPQHHLQKTPAPRKSRHARIVSDDEDEESHGAAVEAPTLPQQSRTPQSLPRSARKQIPGLHMSDDLPMGLSQAFAATMADSQTQDGHQTQEQDSLVAIRDLPSPRIDLVPRLSRLDSLDMVSDSQPASQTQPLNVNLSFSQVPESPSLQRGIPHTQPTPSQAPFEPTQDEGYMFSPFYGNRFSETPLQGAPHSTVDTVIVPQDADASPVAQRKGRLQRGRLLAAGSDEETNTTTSAFEVMRKAIKRKDELAFDKSKSHARDIVDEAAEESDDEYAGLGGASDDDANDEENDDDRALIDHNTQVGQGDEAKLAGLFADRERKNDEAAVSKLLKDITTGALRRKRGVNDDLDLSDEEDAVARRREAKRREFAKMRRELLKDEAVGKIAEDRRKEAFLKSIEDREERSDDDDDDVEQAETPTEDLQSQQPQDVAGTDSEGTKAMEKRKQPLRESSASQLNSLRSFGRRSAISKPSTLAEIRESVSFLIEEPDSQSASVDLGLANSDSDSEPEAYINLDRHLNAVEADEDGAADDEDEDDLDDFIVDDDGAAKENSQNGLFKKPGMPSQTSMHKEQDRFAARRANRSNVVNRLSLLRQSSSTSSSDSVSATTKMAFYATSSNTSSTSFKAPSLLRRATTNSSLSSLSSENVSATGVSTRTERGHVSEEKEFVRKAKGGVRNSVNYRPSVKEERMSARAGVTKKTQKKGGGGFLTGLFRSDSWE